MYEILPGNSRTNWISLLIPIAIWAVLYYTIFRFSIEKFDLKTPGRKDGAEILIHVGIDTVEMKGKGFTSYIKKGDKIKTGDLLLEADLELIKKQGYDTTTMIIITNSVDYSEIKIIGDGYVEGEDKLLELMR